MSGKLTPTGESPPSKKLPGTSQEKTLGRCQECDFRHLIAQIENRFW